MIVRESDAIFCYGRGYCVIKVLIQSFFSSLS